MHALDTIARMKPSAASFVSRPAAGPNTEKTAATAVMKPPIPEIRSAGSTHRIARIGRPYITIEVSIARSTAMGTSRCGSFISSPAALVPVLNRP